MRIGFFTDRYFPLVDGVAVSIETFRRELEKLGHKVFIFCPAGAKKDLYEPERIIRFRSYPSIWYEDHRDTMPWTPHNINKIKSFKLDIIHVHTPAQIGLLGMRIAIMQNLPLVSTHHTDIEKYAKIYKGILAGMLAGSLIGPIVTKRHRMIRETLPVFKPEKTFEKWNSRVTRRILSTYYNNNDLVVVPSKKMFDQLISYGVKSKIMILPTGAKDTEISEFNPREYYKIGSDSPLILFTGRLGKEKNISLIIDSFALINRKKPEAKLLLVGDGPYRQELVSKVNKMGLKKSIIFTGLLSHEDTFACYKTSNMFVFPSTTDTQGIVLNEAALNALPIVYCDDQISEVTINNQTGLIAKEDKYDLAKKLLLLIDNPKKARSFGENAQKLARKFSASKQAKKLEKVYQALIYNYKML